MTTPPQGPAGREARSTEREPSIREWRWVVIAFMGLIVALAGLGTLNDESSQLYFGVIGLLVVLGVVTVLALLARGAGEGRERSYFGAISTLLASVAGLTGGIAGGAVVGQEQGETAGRAAGQRVAADTARRTTDAARDTARETATDAARDTARRAARRTARETLEQAGEGGQ